MKARTYSALHYVDFLNKIHTVRDKIKRNLEGKMSNLPSGNHTIVAIYLHIANGS